jgi:hypothetical protein
MPHARLYMIADTTVISDVDNYAAEWDPLDGSDTFSKGQPLTADGGSTITHRAANTLADHPEYAGTPINVDQVLDRPKSPPILDIYVCDDAFGQGAVYKLGWDGTQMTETEVGSGDLQTLALQDAGLEVYQNDSLLE